MTHPQAFTVDELRERDRAWDDAWRELDQQEEDMLLFQVDLFGAFMVEILLTALLVLVVLLVTRADAAPGFAGLAIGLVLTVVHLMGIPLTGTSVNPARSIGPAVFAGVEALSQLWLFIVAPLVGALLAVGVLRVLTPGRAAVADSTSERDPTGAAPGRPE